MKDQLFTKAIPSDKNHPFKLFIDGEETAFQQMYFKSPYGRLELGLRPEGYVGWVFEEPGGAVTLPFCYSPKGEILVGLLKENRPNMHSTAWCIPGGIIKDENKEESNAEGIAREYKEESGNTGTHSKFKGAPNNWSRLYHRTEGKEDGVHSYFIKVNYKDLKNNRELLVLPPLPGMKAESTLAFFHWKEAIKISSDVLARATIAQLLAMEL